ncbi:hypothetical protein K488DRAFT_71341 [Vararia minispora EC-137]|uniref:Uncharacterized protein n=1 Tax=Vararia minispora EC-137 TaxID=1314806 RepID=A0ACB8QI42_9AGAM|nr:hypothetical protein K488DRAFT_71341 [Vararia minispora EC-137]
MSPLSVMLLMIYGGGIFIHIFGMCVSTCFNCLQDIRADVMLALLSSLFVLFTSIVRVIIHTAIDKDIIGECVAIAAGDQLTTRLGVWGPSLPASALPLARSVAVNFTALALIGLIVWDNMIKDREDRARARLDPIDARNPVQDLDNFKARA